jgi:hypothetical protein
MGGVERRGSRGRPSRWPGLLELGVERRGIPSKEPAPDLQLGAVRATLRRSRDAKHPRSVSANVEVHAARAFLRRLRKASS